MKKLSYFLKPSQRKLLIILSSTRLHCRIKEKDQIMDLSIISLIKDHFNQPAFTAFLKMDQLLLNIILHNNYENELVYMFNVYKDNIDAIQTLTEAFSMSTMFQGSNCKSFSDILEHLESLY